MSETPLSAEAQELLRRMNAHTTEAMQCCYRRIDDIALEQKSQRKMHAHTMVEQAGMKKEIKAHEKRLDKNEENDARVTRKVWTMAGLQTALITFLHIKGH